MTRVDDFINAVQHTVDNFSKYPTTDGMPYMPNKAAPWWQTFSEAGGIGLQEGLRNRKFKRDTDGVYVTVSPHLENKFDRQGRHIPYSEPFWRKVEDTAYAPFRTTDKFTQQTLKNSGYTTNYAGNTGYMTGRILGDLLGYGTRSRLWNLFPEDLAGTFAAMDFATDDRLHNLFGLEPGTVHRNPETGDLEPAFNLGIKNSIRVGAAAGLGLGAGNWTPFNLAQGGRPAGFQAISPDEEDPRISTQPAVDFIAFRGMLGRNGGILPWEQFRLERPDVTYQDYSNYRDYLYNRDPGPLNKMTGGLLKTNMDGLDGSSPEIRFMGYRVTPEGILGAAAGALLPIAAVRTGQAMRRAIP